VVFDRRLRTPASAKLFSTLETGPVIIVTTPEAIANHPERVRELGRAGAELEPIKGGKLTDAFERLGSRDTTSVVLEGGTSLHAAAWEAGLVDAVHLYVAPVNLGIDGVPWLDVETLSLASLTDSRVTPVGSDVFIEGYVHGID